MKTTCSALAALFLSAAAFAQSTPWQKIEGQHSRIAQRRVVAVADSTAWAKVWREHDADAPVPAVDFSKESVVAVFLGETSAAGVKVEIAVQDDPIDADRLNVFYKEVRPASKPFAATMICRPYAIVKVRKAATVSIEADGKASIPEKTKTPANPRDTAKMRALFDVLSAPPFDGR